MRIFISLLVLWGFALSAACQSNPLASGEPVAQTETSEAPSQENTTQVPAPTLTEEATSMPSITPQDEATEKMVALVKEHLANRLNVTVDQIVLVEIESVVWRDAGLGCPKPAIDYLRKETPGYRIVLEAGRQTYNYHTDQVKRFVMCNRR